MDTATTEQIDDVFKRIESKIDLKKIQSEEELLAEINRQGQSKGKWNKILNKAVWDRLSVKRGDKIEFFKTIAKAEKRTTYIAKSLTVAYKAVFRKDGRVQVVGQSTITGRFVKVDKEMLKRLI